MGLEADAGLVAISAICAGRPERRSEGPLNYILMPGLKFLVKDQQSRQMDGLLCLNYPNPAYPTKLYLPERIVVNNLNWNETASILARPWHTWSWRDVGPDQPPIAILVAHLKAFQ